jgi:hypothetical protein
MGRMKDAMITAWEAGLIPIDSRQLLAWRAAGHDVPTRRVTVDGFSGPVRLPAITVATAERLADSLSDGRGLDGLRQSLADMVGYLEATGRRRGGCKITQWLRGRAASRRATAARLAGEIVAAVAAGEELPDEWYQRDTYADAGEPESEEVCRLVREELQGTGITV